MKAKARLHNDLFAAHADAALVRPFANFFRFVGRRARSRRAAPTGPVACSRRTRTRPLSGFSQGHWSDVTSVKIHPNAHSILSCSRDATCRLGTFGSTAAGRSARVCWMPAREIHAEKHFYRWRVRLRRRYEWHAARLGPRLRWTTVSIEAHPGRATRARDFSEIRGAAIATCGRDGRCEDCGRRFIAGEGAARRRRPLSSTADVEARPRRALDAGQPAARGRGVAGPTRQSARLEFFMMIQPVNPGVARPQLLSLRVQAFACPGGRCAACTRAAVLCWGWRPRETRGRIVLRAVAFKI